jgi:hypothetical protein
MTRQTDRAEQEDRQAPPPAPEGTTAVPTLDADAVRTEIAETETDLVLTTQDAEGCALSIPGFEAVLTLTAVKIVIPVCSGLLGAGLSRRLRVRSRRDAEAAVAAIAVLAASGAPADPGSVTTIDQLRRDIVAMIVADGIDAQLADAVVTRTLARVRNRYFPPKRRDRGTPADGQPFGPPAT